MVFKKRRGGRRVYRRRFGPRRIKARVRRVEKRVKRIASTIETKHRDIYQSPVAVYYSSPQWEIVNYVPIGTAENQRVGQKIRCTSADINFILTPSTQNPYTIWRVMILWEFLPRYELASTDPGDEDPTLVSVLGDVATASQVVLSGRQWLWRKRFRTLYDRSFTIYFPCNHGGSPNRQNTNISIVKKSLHFKMNRTAVYNFTSTGSTNAQYFQKGIMWLLFVNNDSSNGGAEANYWTRIKYQDA